MTPGDFLGLVAVITGLLLGTLMLTGAYKRRLDFKLRKLELETQAKLAGAAPQADRQYLLEDRIRVLERIATDRCQDIAYQIESLRERQLEQRSEAL